MRIFALLNVKNISSEKIMKSLKLKLCLIAALAAILFASLGAFVSLNAFAERNVTITRASAFNAAGNAQVWAHKVEKATEPGADDIEDNWFYSMFVFTADDDAINYRRNLAYKWFYNSADCDDYKINTPVDGGNGKWSIGGEDTDIDYDPSVTPEVDPATGNWKIGETVTDIKAVTEENAAPATGYFRMKMGFEELNFEKFTVTFETQQYNMTEDKKTVNYIIFIPGTSAAGTADKVYAVITSDKELAEKNAADIPTSGLTAIKYDNIVISMSEEGGLANGEFSVKVYSEDENLAGAPTVMQEGKFENVGRMYAEYSTSSTTPVTPISFKAKLPEGATSRVRMPLYELNGQSFILNRTSDGAARDTNVKITKETIDDTEYYSGGQINDDVPPVLCLTSGLTFVKKGGELNLSVKAIDVIVASPTVVTGYFILSDAQAKDTSFNPENPTDKALFRTVTSDMDQYVIPHGDSYLPVAVTDYEEDFFKDLTPCAAVKVYVKLTDTSSTGGQSAYVMMDWFVEDAYKIHVNNHDYIAVAEDKKGASYKYEDTSADWTQLVKAYQKKVDEAAADLRAGADDFYLPSFESLVSDNADSYKDMSYSIYYMADGSWSQNTNRSFNQLYIDLTAAGEYKFTVYAQDSASNKMWYHDADKDEDVEFSVDEIQTMYADEDDEGLRDKLPWFIFSAGVADISVKDPGEQDTAYVGQTYTADSFEIEGVSTTAVYTLYRFENDIYFADHGKYLSYEQFMQDKEQLFEDYDYLTRIPALSELDSGSDEYEQFSKYEWNSSSRSFVPQDGTSFYLIRCKVTSSLQGDRSVSAFMGISASATPAAIKGEDTWLQDNMASIILLTIAGAAVIGIVLLLVIKPKNKGDIDVQYAEEVSAKSSKKKNK